MIGSASGYSVRPKFIVDVNVGNLTAWLRALGYDTQFINPIDDGRLIAFARTEGRIVITRDGGIAERRLVKSGEVVVCMIAAGDLRQQLKQVVSECDLDGSLQFTRCLKCNSLLDRSNAAEARAHVPPRTAAIFDKFWHCSQCGRYYWQGSHCERMCRVLESMGIRRSP